MLKRKKIATVTNTCYLGLSIASGGSCSSKESSVAKTKSVSCTTTIGDALVDCASAMQELHDEIESWKDSMPESLQGGDKYATLEETASALENASQLEDYADKISEKLEELAEGREAVVPCPKHVIGTPCPACKWDGVGQKNPKAKSETRKEATGLGSDPSATMLVGRIGGFIRPGGVCYCYEVPGKVSKWRNADAFEGVKMFPNEAAARAGLAEAIARVEAKYPPIAPPERQEVTALALFEPAAKLPEVKYNEQQAYKGKSLSRADRHSNAMTVGSAAVNELQNWLETAKEWKPEDGSEITTEHTDMLDEIASAIEEYETTLSEMESVEFPGMFGG